MLAKANDKWISRCLLMAWLLAMITANSARAQKVNTVAGGAYKNGVATATALSHPFFAVYDAKGNLYFADEWQHRLLKLTAGGKISVVAGTGISGYNGDGIKAKMALLSYPVGVVIDGGGNLILSDSGHYRVRKIDSKGIITTIAGNGVYGNSGDGGPATSANIGQIFGIAFDANGNLYLADITNSVIRMVDTSGIIHTVAGNGVAGFGGDGGPATAANLNQPIAVVTDSANNLYIADLANARVRKVDSSGKITTFAGNGSGGCKGDGGLATAATTGSPRAVMVSGGNLLISTGGCGRVRSVNLSTNVISTVAGSSAGFNGDGQAGQATKFDAPSGLATDRSGNLVIVDTRNERVRMMNQATGTVSTIAGGNLGDGGPGTSASLNQPEGIAFDPSGNLYIADTFDHRVREVSGRTIATLAGTGFNGYSGDGGPATAATLQSPNSVAADSNGNVYIADQFGGFALRKVDSHGIINTFALSYNFGGPAPFDILASLATDSGGNIYGTDYFGCVLWKSTPAGAFSIVAGVQYFCGYNGDGLPATEAWLNLDVSSGVSIDAQGNVYIGDSFNNLVRRVDANTGVISTVAGTVGAACTFGGDGGPATSALLCSPEGVALDAKGNLMIADLFNFRVRTVNSAGIIQTLAGTGIQGYNGNGKLAIQTNLDYPASVAVKSPGFVYEADILQNRTRKIH